MAQSAGDEQYSNPFPENPPAKQSPAGPSPAGPSPAAPSPATQSPPSSPAQSAPGSSHTTTSQGPLASSSSPDASAGSSSTSGTLPRTGLGVWMLAAVGGLMLLGGFVLRLFLRPLPRRAAGTRPPTLGRDVRLTRPRRR